LLRVGLIFGGKSTEHHVSVASALSIINHYDTTNIKLDIFGVTEGGAWLSSKETHFRLEKIQESGWGSLGIDTEPNILHNPDVISGLEKCDVIFPIIMEAQVKMAPYKASFRSLVNHTLDLVCRRVPLE
jgi:D-alanine-D-alanine ligase